LEQIANLSDAGLRRSAFHHVTFNRLIVREWLRQAGRRGLPLAPLTDYLSLPGSLSDQFQRLLEIGVRLNGRAEAGDLPDFIMQELVELTGAERAALVLVDEGGSYHNAAVHLPLQASDFISHTPFEPEPQQPEGFLAEITPFLDESAHKRAGLLRHQPEEVIAIEQQSRMCVPLVVQGQLIGLAYADLEGCFGRFEQVDLDLLSMLANQAAVALDNAQWAQGLEQKVEDRTEELQERIDELAILNSVGEAMAKTLDVKTCASSVTRCAIF
jgi:GAF domain-containing protein